MIIVCIFLIEFHVVFFSLFFFFFFFLLLFYYFYFLLFSRSRVLFSARFSSESISQQVALDTCSPTALLITVFKVSSQSFSGNDDDDELYTLFIDVLSLCHLSYQLRDEHFFFISFPSF